MRFLPVPGDADILTVLTFQDMLDELACEKRWKDRLLVVRKGRRRGESSEQEEGPQAQEAS